MNNFFNLLLVEHKHFAMLNSKVMTNILSGKSKIVSYICRFLSELGRHNYVTPTSYLELIAAFRILLTQKRDTVMSAKNRYTNGLDKLAFAESQVMCWK